MDGLGPVLLHSDGPTNFLHVSGGVGIGGVLEPPQAAPVVIEDDVMLGTRCMVVEGARVGAGAVLGAGTILVASIPVIKRLTEGERHDRATLQDVLRSHGSTA